MAAMHLLNKVERFQSGRAILFIWLKKHLHATSKLFELFNLYLGPFTRNGTILCDLYVFKRFQTFASMKRHHAMTSAWPKGTAWRALCLCTAGNHHLVFCWSASCLKAPMKNFLVPVCSRQVNSWKVLASGSFLAEISVSRNPKGYYFHYLKNSFRE